MRIFAIWKIHPGNSTWKLKSPICRGKSSSKPALLCFMLIFSCVSSKSYEDCFSPLSSTTYMTQNLWNHHRPNLRYPQNPCKGRCKIPKVTIFNSGDENSEIHQPLAEPKAEFKLNFGGSSHPKNPWDVGFRVSSSDLFWGPYKSLVFP